MEMYGWIKKPFETTSTLRLDRFPVKYLSHIFRGKLMEHPRQPWIITILPKPRPFSKAILATVPFEAMSWQTIHH
jgi:hypothetical protein